VQDASDDEKNGGPGASLICWLFMVCGRQNKRQRKSSAGPALKTNAKRRDEEEAAAEEAKGIETNETVDSFHNLSLLSPCVCIQ